MSINVTLETPGRRIEASVAWRYGERTITVTRALQQAESGHWVDVTGQEGVMGQHLDAARVQRYLDGEEAPRSSLDPLI